VGYFQQSILGRASLDGIEDRVVHDHADTDAFTLFGIDLAKCLTRFVLEMNCRIYLAPIPVRSSEKCFSGPTVVIYLQAARSSAVAWWHPRGRRDISEL
jgi:hypothetical protein